MWRSVGGGGGGWGGGAAGGEVRQTNGDFGRNKTRPTAVTAISTGDAADAPVVDTARLIVLKRGD